MKKDLIFISALAFVLFMLFAQAIPIIDGDSAFYATIAKNIVHSGNWITLKFVDAKEIIDKPPMAMWLMAASFKIFGVNEFALSLWHSLLALGIILLTYFMGYEAAGRKGGFLSSIILLLSAQFFYICRTPMLDIPLTFFITLSCFGIFKLIKTDNPAYYYLIASSCAFSVLTKGPVGLAIPAAILFIYSLLSKKIKLLLNYHIISSGILFFIIAAPWFIVEYKILGSSFGEIFFSRNLFRFIRPTDVIGDLKTIAPQYDFYSYFLQIFLLFAPWSGFIYPSIIYSIKKQNQRLFLIWAIVAVFIFAFSLNYKIGRYILPAFPALSIITACFILDAMEKGSELKKYIRLSGWLNAILVIPLLTLGTIFLFIKFPEQQLAFRPIALPFLTVFTLGIIVGTVYIFQNKLKNAVLTFSTSAIIAYIAFITFAAVFIDYAMPTRALCNEINSIAKANDVILKYGGEQPRQEYFYLNEPLIYVTDIGQLNSYLKLNKRVYGLTQDIGIKNTQATVIKEINGYYLFSN